MPRVDTSFRLLRARHKSENVAALSGVFDRMKADVAARHADGAKTLVAKRWAGELSSAILERNKATATEVALRVVKALKPKRADDDEDYDPDVMLPWLTKNAQFAGQGVASRVEDMLDTADDDDEIDDPVGHVFGGSSLIGGILLSAVQEIAQRMVTTTAGFASRDAAQSQGGASKMWQVNSGNPRSSHAAMDGETAAMGEPFSNGMQWPGDPDGGPDENANCQCSLTLYS